MVGLVDCNNFYVSCHRSFDPSLEGKPVIVLSNNDGCVVARSNQAKELGITMGKPLFQIEDVIKAHQVKIFSSTYPLYGDMSARVMGILGRFVEEVEIYSIDEAFLNLAGYDRVYPDRVALAQQIRSTVAQWTRIPVSVGIAPTKTLAKVANWYAKRELMHNGVLELTDPSAIQAALEEFAVEELWGVGHRYAGLLKRNGIKTAWQLSQVHDVWIQKHMTVNGLRLAYELRGTPCRQLELEPAKKKSICTAPSFGRLVPDLATIKEALATHVARAAEKLRRQHSTAGVMTVFLHTNRFKDKEKQYYNSRTVELPHPTASTSELLHYAGAALESIYQEGYEFQKVGVILSDFTPENHRQPGLYSGSLDERLVKLSGVMDKLNTRHGRDKVRLAAQGFCPTWQMKQQWLSPCYTTRWKDILVVK
ncbi:Y-family DNA polymerase [Nibrella saemangeumensis]|uniref:Y-family DNA polymerase n=1 Tax=Nibrella saemangeumensis TaxID=1084526 RepID=A0ABP8NA28_9BACT